MGDYRVIEAFNLLDIRYLHRNGLLIPGRSFPLSWTRSGQDAGAIWIDVYYGCVGLSYFYSGFYGSESVETEVSLDWTPCTYGAERPWFLCPGCGRRVGILALAGKYFRCRHCHQLYYASQFETDLDRANRKIQKLWNRLNRKGLHQKTRDRLLDKLAERLTDGLGNF